MLNISSLKTINTVILPFLALLLGNAWAELGSYNSRSRGIGPAGRGVPFPMNNNGNPYRMMVPQNMFYRRVTRPLPYLPVQNRYPMAPAIPMRHQHFAPRPVHQPMRRPFIETPKLRPPGFKRIGPLPRVVTRTKPPHHHNRPGLFHPLAKVGPHPSIEQKMMHKARKIAKAKAVFRTVPKAKSFSGLLAHTALGSQLGG